MDVIDGSLQSASPCPPELLIMAPRYSDPGNIQRSRHTRLLKSGAMDRGYHLLCWTSNTWNWDGSERFNEVLKKFRSAEYRESVALKKRRILAWIYSGTLQLPTAIKCQIFLWYHNTISPNDNCGDFYHDSINITASKLLWYRFLYRANPFLWACHYLKLIEKSAVKLCFGCLNCFLQK